MEDVSGAAVRPPSRAASEAAGCCRSANMTPRRADTGVPARCLTRRRHEVLSRGNTPLANTSLVNVPGNLEPSEEYIKNVDTQCQAGSRATVRHTQEDILSQASGWAPALITRPSASYHAPYSWLRRAWLVTLLVVATVGVLGTPVAANIPPRFVLDGQSEIVIRLTEGEATPVGEYHDVSVLVLLLHRSSQCCVSSKLHVWVTVTTQQPKQNITICSY